METKITATTLIDQLQLQAHPEGGWYRRTYQSEEMISAAALPQRFNGSRNISTAIFYLIGKGSFSAFHRIKSDEVWHFYTGDALVLYIICPSGFLETIVLGNELEKGQVFQYVVPAGCWFAAEPATESAFSLVGCTVAPGFDFDDFELAESITLEKAYPQYQELIKKLCR